MAVKLEKGHRINLEKQNGSRLAHFCVGCNWGSIVAPRGGFWGFGSKKEIKEIDLDLSCVMLDKDGQIVDYLYSPEYRKEFLAAHEMQPGKLLSSDGALQHSGDDKKGTDKERIRLDNEIIEVNLNKVNPKVCQIFFFLNSVGPEDFSTIPYASIRMYEGTPSCVHEIFASYDVSAEKAFKGHRALIMGKLYKKNGEWRFSAIGDATTDNNICLTINRICKDYSKVI